MLSDSYQKNCFLFQTTQTVLIRFAARLLENLALDGSYKGLHYVFI